jgi:hypothetical protein
MAEWSGELEEGNTFTDEGNFSSMSVDNIVPSSAAVPSCAKITATRRMHRRRDNKAMGAETNTAEK